MAGARKHGETFEQYKARRKEEAMRDRIVAGGLLCEVRPRRTPRRDKKVRTLQKRRIKKFLQGKTRTWYGK